MIERLSGLALLGSTFVVGLLFGVSIWVFARAMERWSFFRERRDDVNRVGDELVSRLRHGDFDGADFVLSQSPSIEAASVRPGLDWLDGGPAAVEAAIDAQRVGIRRELERSLLPIGIIGRQAPWLGFLALLISLFDTIRSLDHEQAKDTMSALFHGISIGLIPACAGVIVGIATSITHEILVQKILYIDAGVAILTKRLMALLCFKSHLAREFGLSGNGHDSGAIAEREIDDELDRRRPVSMAEMD